MTTWADLLMRITLMGCLVGFATGAARLAALAAVAVAGVLVLTPLIRHMLWMRKQNREMPAKIRAAREIYRQNNPDMVQHMRPDDEVIADWEKGRFIL